MTTRFASATIALAAAALAACGSPSAETAPGTAIASAANPVERGRYLVGIMDCTGCHNRGAFGPRPEEGYLEGGAIGFEIPGLGVFYPPNLTPHREAGLGRWSEEDIVRAIRAGQRPDGRELAPAMPWRAYAALTDEDARAVAAYLKSLPPSANRVPGPASVDNAPAPYLTVRAPQGAAGLLAHPPLILSSRRACRDGVSKDAPKSSFDTGPRYGFAYSVPTQEERVWIRSRTDGA